MLVVSRVQLIDTHLKLGLTCFTLEVVSFSFFSFSISSVLT
jgi:hypothetical protein